MKKNKKGQSVGIVLMAAITILVGVILFTTIAQNVGTTTTIGTSANASFTIPANGSTSDLSVCGQQNTTSVVIYDVTGGLVLPYGNYTVAQATSSTTGYLQTQITAVNINSTYAGSSMNVSCSFQPNGYITDGGGRSIASLITIFVALGIMGVALIPSLRSGLLKMVK